MQPLSALLVEKLEKSERSLQQAYEVQKSLLSTVPAHILLVSHEGVVLAVNGAWERFIKDGNIGLTDFGIGQKYLDLCGHSLAIDAEDVGKTAAGLRDILSRKS